jgi:hypothetical protein
MRGAPGVLASAVVPAVTLVLVAAFVACAAKQGTSLPDGGAQADSADTGSDGAVDSALDVNHDAPTDATSDSNHEDVDVVPEGGGAGAGSRTSAAPRSRAPVRCTARRGESPGGAIAGDCTPSPEICTRRIRSHAGDDARSQESLGIQGAAATPACNIVEGR